MARITVALAVCVPSLCSGGLPAAHADTKSWIRRLVSDYGEARAVSKGAGVTVAILDTGAATDVHGLSGALQHEHDLIDLHSPSHVEGTILASIIAREGTITLGPRFTVPGLVPDVKVLPVRIAPDFKDRGADAWYRDTDISDIMVRGIRYAADHGAGIILVGVETFGNYSYDLEEAVSYARTKNAVVVAPDGPVGNTVAPLPASVPGVIGVAAQDGDGTRMAKYSSKNSAVLVAGPGFRLPYTGPGNKLYDVWGAVPASAWVTAAIAMVKSRFPKLTPAQIARAISISAHHPKGGYNTEVGFGTIDPVGALKEATKIQRHPEAPTATRGIVADDARFAHGRVRIEAVRHSAGRLAGFGALTAAGLAALVAAGILLLRGRRLAPASAGDAPGDGPPLPSETTGGPLPLDADGPADEPEITDVPRPAETDGAADAVTAAETSEGAGEDPAAE